MRKKYIQQSPISMLIRFVLEVIDFLRKAIENGQETQHF